MTIKAPVLLFFHADPAQVLGLSRGRSCCAARAGGPFPLPAARGRLRSRSRSDARLCKGCGERPNP